MALPVLPILIGAGLVLVASSKSSSTPDSSVKTLGPPSRAATSSGTTKSPYPGTGGSSTTTPGGKPNVSKTPISEMWGGRELSPKGEIIPGYWFDTNDLDSEFFKDFYFKSDPIGALALKVKDTDMKFVWRAYMPKEDWPKEWGGVYRVKLAALKPLLGPGADWKRMKEALKVIPGAIAGAVTGVAALVGTSGMAAAVGGAGMGSKMIDDIVASVESIRKPINMALKASEEVLVRGYFNPAYRSIKTFNRHAINPRNSRLDIGKNYKCDPELEMDLKRGSGNCRPLIYIPTDAEIEQYVGRPEPTSTPKPLEPMEP